MKKSVLFICADQWRWDCFGFMKHKNVLTPNIDKLVKKSTAFTSHYAGITPCGPARTTMLTGLYPFIHRSVTNGAPLDKRFTNIAKEVSKIGYEPDLYGYTDTSWDPRYLEPQDEKNFTYESPMEGFNTKCLLPGSEPEAWAEHLNNNGFKINHASELYKSRQARKGQAFIHKPYNIPTEHSDTAFLANKVIEDLASEKNSFFKHVSFLKPHPPFHVADPWFSQIHPENIDLPIANTSMEELSHRHPLLKEISKKFLNEKNFTEIRFSELTEKDIKNIKSTYFGMCSEVDHNIGKILKALENSGQINNTMIIFTSDHGEMLGENNLWGKLGWWDSSYRIPLVVHIPDQTPCIINEMTESVDLAPTILDWLGGDIPLDWNGRSLLPYINNQRSELPPKEYVVFDYDFRESTSFVEKKILAPEECNLSVIRTRKWKYVHFPSLPSLLFNLKEDTCENNNLAELSEYQSIKNELLSKLLSHRMLHQERQLSNTMLSLKGVRTNSGPYNRRLGN